MRLTKAETLHLGNERYLCLCGRFAPVPCRPTSWWSTPGTWSLPRSAGLSCPRCCGEVCGGAQTQTNQHLHWEHLTVHDGLAPTPETLVAPRSQPFAAAGSSAKVVHATPLEQCAHVLWSELTSQSLCWDRSARAGTRRGSGQCRRSRTPASRARHRRTPSPHRCLQETKETSLIDNKERALMVANTLRISFKRKKKEKKKEQKEKRKKKNFFHLFRLYCWLLMKRKKSTSKDTCLIFHLSTCFTFKGSHSLRTFAHLFSA